MKKVWNKETRNEDGKYYRNDDWGVEVEDTFLKDNFTDVEPPDGAYEGIPCDWDGNNWIRTTEDENALITLKRRKAYPPENDLIVALWEKIVEGRNETVDALQIKRLTVKELLPKIEER